jgi:hypothetical protein
MEGVAGDISCAAATEDMATASDSPNRQGLILFMGSNLLDCSEIGAGGGEVGESRTLQDWLIMGPGLNGSKELFQQFAEKILAKGLDPARGAKKQQLISPWPAAMIHSCLVSPVVAAVLRFARRGDLGLAIRSTS